MKIRIWPFIEAIASELLERAEERATFKII
jgi:hypothetical protein